MTKKTNILLIFDTYYCFKEIQVFISSNIFLFFSHDCRNSLQKKPLIEITTEISSTP